MIVLNITLYYNLISSVKWNKILYSQDFMALYQNPDLSILFLPLNPPSVQLPQALWVLLNFYLTCVLLSSLCACPPVNWLLARSCTYKTVFLESQLLCLCVCVCQIETYL